MINNGLARSKGGYSPGSQLAVSGDIFMAIYYIFNLTMGTVFFTMIGFFGGRNSQSRMEHYYYTYL